MPFITKQTTGAYDSAIAALAEEVGRGQKREKEQARRDDNRFKQQSINLQEDQLDQQWKMFVANQEAEAARSNNIGRNRLAEQQLQNQGKIDAIAAEYETQRALKEQELQNKLASGNYDYTPQQRREFLQLIEAERRVISDPGIPPEHKAQMLAEINQRKYAITGNPSQVLPQGNKPSFEQQFKENSYTMPDGTVVFQNPNDGKVITIKPVKPDVTKIAASLVKEFFDVNTNTFNKDGWLKAIDSIVNYDEYIKGLNSEQKPFNDPSRATGHPGGNLVQSASVAPQTQQVKPSVNPGERGSIESPINYPSKGQNVKEGIVYSHPSGSKVMFFGGKGYVFDGNAWREI